MTPADLIASRANTHGEFTATAVLAQRIKIGLRECPGWTRLTDRQREALDLIATKVARILNGNPNHADHWDDIGGYSELGKGAE